MEGKIPDNQNKADVPHASEDSFGQKTIRTYESDIAEAIAHKRASQVSINLAQTERQRAEGILVAEKAAEPTRSAGKNILKILLSLVLIGAGGLGSYYLYSISPLATKPTITQQATPLVPSIIMPDVQKTLNIQGESDAQILNQLQSQSQNGLTDGQIMELVLYEPQGTTDTKITGPEFISDIGLTPPDILTRSLTDTWMLGVYQGNAGPEPFITLTTNFFQNAFSGMLKWEPTMPDDLSRIFNSVQQSAPVVAATAVMSTSSVAATSTAATTSAAAVPVAPPASFFGIRGIFVDKVIQNKDVREFQDQNGKILFVYAFLDNATLVIAQKEDALNEVITRFEKRAYIR